MNLAKITVYVNETGLDKIVHNTQGNAIHLRPGDAVMGDHYAKHAERGRLTLREVEEGSVVVKHNADDPRAGAIARKLKREKKLAAKVDQRTKELNELDKS